MPMESLHTYDEDLVRFMYRDLPAEDATILADCIDSDLEVRQAYDQMLESKLQLPKVLFEPLPSTIDNILRYSAKTAR